MYIKSYLYEVHRPRIVRNGGEATPQAVAYALKLLKKLVNLCYVICRCSLLSFCLKTMKCSSTTGRLVHDDVNDSPVVIERPF